MQETWDYPGGRQKGLRRLMGEGETSAAAVRRRRGPRVLMEQVQKEGSRRGLLGRARCTEHAMHLTIQSLEKQQRAWV